MENDEENTLVINDLLSFVSCKLSIFSKKKLVSVVKEFYPAEEITQAYDTLIECLPKSFYSKFKLTDPLNSIFTLLVNLPEESTPIFVCQNINNVPQVKSNSTKSAAHVFPGSNLSTQEQRELQEEHSTLRTQITEVSMVVRQLKDQMEILVNKYKAYEPEESNTKKKTIKKVKPNAKASQVKNAIKPKKSMSIKMDESDLDEGLSEEEVTGALIDTSRIRAQRKQPNGTSQEALMKNKSLKRKFTEQDPSEGIIMTATSEDDDDDESQEEEETDSGKSVSMKPCFISLDRCDPDDSSETIVIKKEPEDVDLVKTSSGRPVRQKFSKFSEDYVVDFGGRSTKKSKK